ncbi:AMP-binding protein [Actinoplanes sp. NPDC051494]|uniref:AMP-binding protein n=1 Tax=Actinoplanes sp. NPDC051494 TaxID=3363907 RepID=UPI0037879813
MKELLAGLRPPPGPAGTFRARGWWRDHSVLHELYRGGAAHPDRVAIMARRGAGPVVRLSYAQLVTYVERFAHALAALGIGAGDPVAYQLPNRWESSALFFACLRIGAVAVPILPGYGARDLRAVLDAAQPRVCVVPDVWGGVPQAEVLADLAGSLPWLRRRVVVGDAAATGALDFTEYFLRTPHERHDRRSWLRVPGEPADRVCLIVTTVGLGDAHSMVMHTPNTLRAGADRRGAAPAEVTWSALPVASLPSVLHAVVGPVLSGGTAVLQDGWDPGTALDLMACAGAGRAYASPAQWAELASVQEGQPRHLTALRFARSADPGGILARRVHDVLGVRLSAGPPAAGTETTLAGIEGTDRLFRILARGPASPLATWRRDTGRVRPTWEHQDGWVDTGDLVRVDDAGRAEPVRRPATDVGGLFLVPVAEVEDGLRAHPRVADAAVVGAPDREYGELACAVVVPVGDPPGLPELREHLLALGVAPAHLPARLELAGALPRDGTGAVQRARLREQVGHRGT